MVVLCQMSVCACIICGIDCFFPQVSKQPYCDTPTNDNHLICNEIVNLSTLIKRHVPIIHFSKLAHGIGTFIHFNASLYN